MGTRIEVVYDWATQYGGGERVAGIVARLLGNVPLTLGLYEPSQTWPELAELDVRTLPLNRVRAFRKNQRLAFPVLAQAFSRFEIDTDLAVVASCGFAHGVRITGRKIVYCYTPARWLYQTDRYVSEQGAAAKLAVAAMGRWMRQWDQAAARTADEYWCLSTAVRDRVREIYGRDATVLHAPYGIDPDGAMEPVPGISPDVGFTLCVARLLPYKNVDAVLEAFAGMPGERLVVVGTGPDRDRLRAMAPENATMVSAMTDAQMRWLFDKARLVVAASHEDYGLTAVEAAAFATPSVVLRWGGFLDTVLEGHTGLFFDRPTGGAIRDAVTEALSRSWDPDTIRVHAESFSESAFAERLFRLLNADPATDQQLA